MSAVFAICTAIDSGEEGSGSVRRVPGELCVGVLDASG
jgi:hypothetical protein